MATENRAVTVYLPPDIERSVIDFCKEYGFTRKDKNTGEVLPVLGTGIVEYLKSAISGTFPITRNVPTSSGHGLNKDEVLDLINTVIEPLQSDLDGFTRTMQDEVTVLKKPLAIV